MKAPVQNRPLSSKYAIHRKRQSRPNALHPRRQSLLSLGLDDEMHVIVHHRVVNDPKCSSFTDPG